MSGAGIAEGGWTSGQARMFPTWGWKVGRGVAIMPITYMLHSSFLSTSQSCQVSLKHEIVAVPTVILFRAGKAVDR